MDRELASHLVVSSIQKLVRRDRELLDLRVCERAVQFRLALYMAQSRMVAKPLVVDCEYNRHLGDEKYLRVAGAERPSLVVPDILVHQRNSDDHNMIALELKRPGNRLGRDQSKLRAYRDQLGYLHVGQVVLGINRQLVVESRLVWIDD